MILGATTLVWLISASPKRAADAAPAARVNRLPTQSRRARPKRMRMIDLFSIASAVRARAPAA
jgi:hypothetical protein